MWNRLHFSVFLLSTIALGSSCKGDLFIQNRWQKVTPEASDVAWGFIDATGQVTIAPRFDEVRDFHEGRAAFREGLYWGYLDPAGKALIKPVYLQAGAFSGNLARVVTRQGKTLFITPSGHAAFTLKCKTAGDFRNHRAPVLIGHRYGYINDKGRLIIRPRFEEAFEFHKGAAVVKWHGYYGLIDRYGKFLLPPEYEKIYTDSKDDDRMYLLKTSNGYTYYDLAERRFIPKFFAKADAFWQGSAVVKKDSLYGVIDRKGRWILQPIFPQLTNLGEGRWAVLWEGQFYMIDANGLQYGDGFKQIYRFSEGLATAQIDAKWGFVDTTGEFVIAPQFTLVWPFHNGIARVVTTDKKVSFVNKTGQFILNPVIADIRDFREGYARFGVPIR